MKGVAILPFISVYSVVVAGHNANRAAEKNNFQFQHAQSGSHNMSQLKPRPATLVSSAASLRSLLHGRTSIQKRNFIRKADVRSHEETQVALLQQESHQMRLRKLESSKGPARGGQYMFGLPKIVIAIVADVIAMMLFLACIPMLLSCAKRR